MALIGPLPSGLSFTIPRVWNLGDHKKLIEVASKDPSRLPLELLSVLRPVVEAPGPYGLSSGDKLDINLLTLIDISMATILVRIATDPMLPFRQKCPQCGELPDEPIIIDLSGMEDSWFSGSPEGMQCIGSRQPHQVSVGGYVLHITPVLGQDVPRMASLQKQDESALTDIELCMHITSVSSSRGMVDGFLNVQRFWREQSWAFQEEVEEAIDILFGGMDDTVWWSCPRLSCGAQNEDKLPLDMKFYGLDPERKRRRRRRFVLEQKSAGSPTPEMSTSSSSGIPRPPVSPSEV